MKPIRSRDHLAFIRTLPCAIRGKGDHVCEGPVQAAHWRGSREGGIGMKPGDDKTLPLCHAAHAEQHRIGERDFEQRYHFSMGDYCALYWAISERVVDDKKTKHRKRHWPKRDLQSAGFDKSHRQRFDGSVVARTGAARMG